MFLIIIYLFAINLLNTLALGSSIRSYLDSVTAHRCCPFEANTLLMCHQEELSQPLLHQTGKALVLSFQRGVFHILNHWRDKERERERH